ncbi:hypothetical protein OS190_04335 [Sulfitobacter sp. F26204]|uniref:hypothetical protein n=1 Tax=Sulfitobacter sp. F26204 TaxID=2996014 RepID=UPI00225DDFE4|nr:hypothetical protein [Sulfitobacter sp. F26204]MCX7558783.1 hypothetical protein [Sulfitobacter sp. F26204]
MTRIDIPTGEIGTTRVFSLSMPPAQARALRNSPQAQSAILGVESLNTDGVEVFPLTDLGDIGLTGYLREGTDAREDDIKRDGGKLAALDGWVMLVHSVAFGGAGGSLTPDSALTLIGTYAQTPAPTTQIDVSAESAKPYTGSVTATAANAQDNRGSATLIVAILCIVAAFILWLAFF